MVPNKIYGPWLLYFVKAASVTLQMRLFYFYGFFVFTFARDMLYLGLQSQKWEKEKLQRVGYRYSPPELFILLSDFYHSESTLELWEN